MAISQSRLPFSCSNSTFFSFSRAKESDAKQTANSVWIIVAFVLAGAMGTEMVAKLLAQRQLLGMGRPEQVAAAAVFLASEEASLITGTSLIVDGGYTAQ